mmetsp:Transcript_528/g.796  ORF Transcript_528/g.796 Transcript_528/m.796 type:complete len:259 (-) Transcript_528:78-854(-)
MLRSTFLRAASLLLLLFVLLTYTYIDTSSFTVLNQKKQQSRRQLRFFDPDHTTCGRDENDPGKLAHAFASATLYGATKEEVKEGYYMRQTISTMQAIPEDLDQVDTIMKVLSYVARKLKRPIRVNKPVLLGYNNEPVQGYSLVSSANLNSVGLKIVEDGYWSRATQAQKVFKMVRHVPLNQTTDPLSVLAALGDDKNVLEYGFDVEDLLKIDLDVVGNLVGEEGGYKNGEWTVRFNCGFEHPKPHAIRPANHILSLNW